MKKVVFIYPNFSPPVRYKGKDIRDGPGIPLPLISVGTYLQNKGYRVKIIDTRLTEEDSEIDYILEECKDAMLVGFSVMTNQIPHALKLCEAIKSNLGVPVIRLL